MAKSVSERAAEGEGTEPDEGDELFPMGALEGDGLKALAKPGKRIKFSVSISRARVPSGSGLADPEKLRVLLVTCEPGQVLEVPHMSEGKVVDVEKVQTYMPVYVEGVQRGDAGRLEAAFRELVKDDPSGSARALDAMQKVASAELAQG